MKFRTIKYYFKEGFKSVFKNGVMSVASIGTVAACIIILVFSFALASNVDFALEQLERTIGVTAIIDDALSAEEVGTLFEHISSLDHVTSVVYISSEEGLERYRQQTNDVSGILIGITLPRTFEVNTDNAVGQALVITQLEKMIEQNTGLTKVNHAQKAISVFAAINNGVRIISIVIILSLCALSVVIIINTILLTVNNRKNEINIMKFIGATDWFIRWPFIIEGILIGLFGSVVPLLIFFFGYNEVISVISENIVIISDVFEFRQRAHIFSFIAPFSVGIGLFLGVIGSALSVRKYLKV